MRGLEFLLFSLLSFNLLLSACEEGSRTSGASDGGPSQLEGLYRLLPAEHCATLEAKLKERATLRMESAMRLQHRLKCDLNWEDSGELDGVEGEPMRDLIGTDGAEGELGERESREGAALDHSDTTLQETEVDEADWIKLAGEHLYLLIDNHLEILKIFPIAEARHLSSTFIPGQARGIYVLNNRLLLYTDIIPEQAPPTESIKIHEMYGDCSFSGDCQFSSKAQELEIQIFDVSQPEEPKLVRKSRFNGGYLDSRRIGDVVHSVISFQQREIPDLDYQLSCEASLEEQIEARRVLIQGVEISQLLPWVEDSIYHGEREFEMESLLGDCRSLFFHQHDFGASFLSVVSQRIDQVSPLQSQSILGKPGAVYASSENLFIAIPHYRMNKDNWFSEISEDEATTIHRFQLLKGGHQLEQGTPVCRYLASGVVPGRVIDAYSMHEDADWFHISTNSGVSRPVEQLFDLNSQLLPNLPPVNPSSWSRLSTLKLQGLSLVGYDRLPLETRYIRFQKNYAFLATTERELSIYALGAGDPWFKKQLSLGGELLFAQMWGSSSMLLLTELGPPSEREGAAGQSGEIPTGTSEIGTLGLSLQLFDLQEREFLSEALLPDLSVPLDFSPHSISLFPARGFLSLPVESYEPNQSAQSIFSIYDEQISAPRWIQQSSGQRRALFLEDSVLSVSEGGIWIFDVEELPEQMEVQASGEIFIDLP